MTVEVETTGRCLCGAVTIAVKGTPVRMAQCHCRDCQRMTGTGHASNAFFNSADVEVAGATNSVTVTTDSGNASIRHFCPVCSSRVFGTNSARPGVLVVPVGVLEDSSWFAPEVVVYTRSAPAWDLTTDAVPHFDAMPPPPPKA
jgi:hypothetical protein